MVSVLLYPKKERQQPRIPSVQQPTWYFALLHAVTTGYEDARTVE